MKRPPVPTKHPPSLPTPPRPGLPLPPPPTTHTHHHHHPSVAPLQAVSGSATPYHDKALAATAALLDEAWAWGYNVDAWRCHLNIMTWPEVLRQFSVVLGAGPSRARPKRVFKPKLGTGAYARTCVSSCVGLRRHGWLCGHVHAPVCQHLMAFIITGGQVGVRACACTCVQACGGPHHHHIA